MIKDFFQKDFKTIDVKGCTFHYLRTAENVSSNNGKLQIAEHGLCVVEKDNAQMFVSNIDFSFATPEEIGEYLVSVLDNYLQGKRLINLTPHDIILKLEYVYFCFVPEKEPARVRTNAVDINDNKFPSLFPLVEQTYGEIEGLPEPQEDTIYIASMVVRNAAKEQGRSDVVSPDTSPAGAIRDEKGMIEAVRRFVR